ncbi:MAG: hypothetical protein CYPHOPRED_003184 [Cyphobasidiales sp. Tagirdzhanova-0007]|nr:MAG: hypothetical protein CYPHOPRED_003184 [Cyphobasidiales sp. Tagirdzhanova-0007]
MGSTEAMTMKPILIIGAGLSGATLAQGLKRRNIPFRIYERDKALIARLQGYRLRLNLAGLQALQFVIPAEVYEEILRTGAEFVPGFIALDALSGATFPAPPPKQSSATPSVPSNIDIDDLLTRQAMTSRLPVDRGVMRNILLSGLAGLVEFGKSFVKYEHTPTGIVAQFVDGSSSIEGSLLVGADGFGSKVTKQLMGDLAKPLDMGSRMFYGKSPLTPELEKAMNSELRQGVRIAIDTSRSGLPTPTVLSLFVETCRFTPPAQVSDYAFWVLTDSAGFKSVAACDEDLLALEGEVAAMVTERAVSHFHDSVKAVILHQDRSLTSVWGMSCAPPNGLPSWKTDHRVTLLGDAIHPMPPTGGLAGNTGLQSVANFIRILAHSQSGNGWTEEEIGEFEAEMRLEANKMIVMAYAAATNKFPFSLWRPLD